MRFFLCFYFFVQITFAQELFVVTDPASNLPTNVLSGRVGQLLFKNKFKAGYNYDLMPEISYGINKKLMIRTTMFTGTTNDNLVFEGASVYAKYRFLSVDDLNTHFRMAAFGRYGANNSNISQEQIETMGHNTGYEFGVVATKLIKKVAVSTSASFEKALNNLSNQLFPETYGYQAFNYTISVGKLMYPRRYTSYKQTNINLMCEFLGQTILKNGKSSVDVVPALQFIFNSQARLDFAYRHQIINSMLRGAPNGFVVNLEYNFYNL